jgi:hypothetical protein
MWDALTSGCLTLSLSKSVQRFLVVQKAIYLLSMSPDRINIIQTGGQALEWYRMATLYVSVHVLLYSSRHYVFAHQLFLIASCMAHTTPSHIVLSARH